MENDNFKQRCMSDRTHVRAQKHWTIICHESITRRMNLGLVKPGPGRINGASLHHERPHEGLEYDAKRVSP